MRDRRSHLPLHLHLFRFAGEAVVVEEVAVFPAEFVQPPGQIHVILAVGDELRDFPCPEPDDRLQAVGALVRGQGGLGQGIEA